MRSLLIPWNICISYWALSTSIFKSKRIAGQAALRYHHLFARIWTGNTSTGMYISICYEKQHIRRIKTVRLPNNIPTAKGESGNLDLPFFNRNSPFFWFRFDTRILGTIGYVYSNSICINWRNFDSWTSGNPRFELFKFGLETIGYHKVSPKGIFSIYVVCWHLVF